MKVKVTLKHIKNGVPKSPDYCPIALALKEKKKGSVYVAFGELDLGGCLYRMPTSAKAFIKSFDKGKIVKPFEFVTELL